MAHPAQRPDDDTEEMERQSVNCYQSAWLDHWKLSSGRSMRARPKMDSPSIQGLFQPEDAVSDPEHVRKSDKFPEKNELAVSTSFQNDSQVASTIFPYGSKSKWPPMQYFMDQQGEIDQSGLVIESQENLRDARFCSYSTFSVGKKTQGPSEFGKLESQLPEETDTALLLHDPSTNGNLLETVVEEEVETLNDHSSIRLLPSWEHPLGTRKLIKPYQALSEIPWSVCDVQTTPLTLPPQMHQFFITKKTNAKLYEGGKVYRDPLISPKFKGKMVSEFLSLSPSFHFPDKRVKLQLLGSSTDDEEIAGDVNCSVVLKNESSAETDAMELDAYQKSHLSGVAFRSLNQSNRRVQDLSTTRQTATSSTVEAIAAEMKSNELPDINLKFPASPTLAISISDNEHSTSPTQSLDAEQFFHARHATNSKSTDVWNSSPGPGPSSRWIKRLKLASSDSLVRGTRSTELGEASSHEKVNKMFSRIMKQRAANSEPTFGISHEKTHAALNQTATLMNKANSSSSNSGRGSGEITLSHFWIQRWCHNRVPSPKKKPEARALSEQQSSKTTVHKIEKKQFPSIGAMALMGKAMTGFHHCEVIRREGSLMIWNT